MKLQDKINKLIPYINENFITYPLWEEGVYVPFVNFWRNFKTVEGMISFHMGHRERFKDLGYELEFGENQYSDIENMYITPILIHNQDGGYSFQNPNWSIEEMIDLLITIIK